MNALGADYPTGKSLYAWQIKNISGGVPSTTSARAKALGLSTVWIKAANGTGAYNLRWTLTGWKDDIMQPWLDALRAVGVGVWAWQYVYGDDPIGEANILLAQQAKYNFAGWIIDAESEYKRPGMALQANRYLSRVRAALAVPLGLSTFRWPSVHPEFPWYDWMRGVDFYAPQVYWVGAHNPAAQLERCISEYHGLDSIFHFDEPRPIIPVGAAYHENGWQPTIAEIEQFFDKAKELSLPGVSWWEWGHTQRYGFEQTIGSLRWTDEPTWAQAIDAWARERGYNGPGPE